MSVNRRDFIRQSSLALAAVTITPSYDFTKAAKPKLCFSTLGCPQWDLPTIVNFASKHGYEGIEIRVLKGELELPGCPDFSTANIGATKRLLSDKNITVVDIGTSSHMHHTDKTLLQKSMDEAKLFTELASKLSCKYIRVFPEKLLPGNEKKASLDTIVENLKTLGDFAKGSGVRVLVESHGDLVYANDLSYVMSNSEDSNTGMIWDITNMWVKTKEAPKEVQNKLRKYIHHVHVKDAKLVDGKEKYVLLGKGEVPVREAIKALSNDRYKGYYSYEWEKLWHPELEEPEVALSLYPGEMNQYFKD